MSLVGSSLLRLGDQGIGHELVPWRPLDSRERWPEIATNMLSSIDEWNIYDTAASTLRPSSSKWSLDVPQYVLDCMVLGVLG